MTATPLPPSARRRGAAAGVLAACLLALGGLAFPDGLGRSARDAVLDALDLAGAGPSGRVTVVDIDRDSLVEVGSWPWPRQTTANLLRRIEAAGPAAVALDVLFAAPSDPAADAALAEAIADGPVVLAALFSDRPDGANTLPPAPVAVTDGDVALSPWRAPGASGPMPGLAGAARGIGLAALSGDPDGRVRHVPLIGLAGGKVVPGLAAEAVRVAAGASVHIVDGARLRIGGASVPLTRGADLRIRPTPARDWRQRTVSAADVLAGRVDPARFAGRIVIVGAGAPALGALRPSAAGPVTPSVQIQADAVDTIVSGSAPWRPAAAGGVEAAVGLAAAVPAALAASSLGIGLAGAVTAGLAVLLAGAATAAFLIWSVVLDPVAPPAIVLAGGLVAALAAGYDARRAAARIRRRFEQHLAPAVVARIVARPDLVKLGGERRVVTALFTDLEDFTGLVERLEPDQLVALLDRYFALVTGIVTAHGGMVDKIVGDAVHALFNAPVDLPDHATRAVEAALAIRAETEAFRLEAGVGLGRTRIGLESGPAVVGDVGGGGRLDYTAHGPAVNTAARLEAMGKTLGEAIVVGPGCRALCPDRAFRALGIVEVRGRGPLEVFTPDA